MLLTKQESARLEELINHKDFEVLLKFAEELKKSIGVAPVYNFTEWDFLKASLQKEFQMSFIEEFLRLLEEEAHA
jgi:hypothetical protein